MPRKLMHADQPLGKPTSMLEGRTPVWQYHSAARPSGSVEPSPIRTRRPTFHAELPQPASMQQSPSLTLEHPNNEQPQVAPVFPPPTWGPSPGRAVGPRPIELQMLEVPKLFRQPLHHDGDVDEDNISASPSVPELSGDFADIQEWSFEPLSDLSTSRGSRASRN